MAENTRLPHIREFLIAEIIARSARKLLDKELTHLIYKAGQLTRNADVSGLSPFEIESKKVEYIREFDSDLKELALRILNLTLSRTEDSELFWTYHLKPQIFADYRFTMPASWSLGDLPTGCVVNPIFYHFNLNMRDKVYDIGSSQPAFEVADIISFKARTKCYGYNRHRVRNLIGRFQDHKDRRQYTKAIHCLDVKLVVEDGLLREQDYLDTLAEKADLFFLNGSYQEAIDTCMRALKRLSTNSPTAIKFMSITLNSYINLKNEHKILETYDAAISMIVYNFGVYHPLHANFAGFLANYYFQTKEYEKSIMSYQKGLNDCLRILGVDHPMTAQFYLDLASVLIKIDRRDEAIGFLQKAFEIFETMGYNENIEKANLASQIGIVLFDFGNHKEAMEFAERANGIYEKKKDAGLIEKVLENHLLVSKCFLQMLETDKATEKAEVLFQQVSNNSVWTSSLGKYIAEALKTVYEVQARQNSYECRLMVFFACDMLHNSFKNEKPIRDAFIMEKLKSTIEKAGNMHNFMTEIFEGVVADSRTFNIANVVNTSYEEFLTKNENAPGLVTMENIKLLYLTLGSDFLLHTLKP